MAIRKAGHGLALLAHIIVLACENSKTVSSVALLASSVLAWQDLRNAKKIEGLTGSVGGEVGRGPVRALITAAPSLHSFRAASSVLRANHQHSMYRGKQIERLLRTDPSRSTGNPDRMDLRKEVPSRPSNNCLWLPRLWSTRPRARSSLASQTLASRLRLAGASSQGSSGTSHRNKAAFS